MREKVLKTESFSRNGSNSSAFTNYRNHWNITRQGKTRRNRRRNKNKRSINNNDNGTKKINSIKKYNIRF